MTEYKLPVDGLKESWKEHPCIYVNPPYGTDRERKTSISNWLEKCLHAYENYNSQIIALIPVATNTGHWKKYIWGKASSICFLADTRLKFLENGQEGGKGSPMACCMIYWGNDKNKFNSVFSKFGSIINI